LSSFKRHIWSVDLVQRRDLFDAASKLVNSDVWISFDFICMAACQSGVLVPSCRRVKIGSGHYSHSCLGLADVTIVLTEYCERGRG
jgi:hypothetical protein